MKYKIEKIKASKINQLSRVLVKVYFESYTGNSFIIPYSVRDKYLLDLRDLKKYINKKYCNIYVALSSNNKVLGGVFYCSNTNNYGLKLQLKSYKTSAIRFLAVDEQYRGMSIGKALISQCVFQAQKDKNKKIVLHTLSSMKEASKIYKQFGFKRFTNIDFINHGVPVEGYVKFIN